MARTKQLTQEELSSIREKINAKYQLKNGTLDFYPSTYKERYSELREDILTESDEAATSVSLNRLRKLFYYTDPSVCPPGQLQKPSFGKDFLYALEKYTSVVPNNSITQNSNYPTEKNRKKKQWTKMPMAIILSLFISVFFYLKFLKPPEGWVEKFDKVSLSALEKNGWVVHDYDSSFFNRQTKAGHFTFWTLPGDYWVKPKEERRIVNLLSKEINCEACEIIVKIVGFAPYQNWQQLSIFLFGDYSPRKNHLTVSYSFAKEPVPFYQPSRNSMVQESQKIDVHLLREGQVIDKSKGYKFRFPEIDTTKPAFLDSLSIRIIYEDGKIRYGVNLGTGFRTMNEEFKLGFQPSRIGIGAFQGLTNSDYQPLNADTIPANVDKVVVAQIRN